MFIVFLALLQLREGARITATIGFVTAACIAIGTGEGLAIAIGMPGDLFSNFTIAGFLGLTIWLIAAGVTMLRVRSAILPLPLAA